MLSLKNYKQLKASSLLESVIAIAIISICILVAFSTYVSVLSKKKSIGFYNAKHQVEALTHAVIIEKDYEDDLFEFDGFSIKKEVEINKTKNRVVLDFIISTSGKTYTMKKVLPYTINDEN